MKVDVITLHYIWHYGSLLQTYATCKMFEKIGFEAEIIDYVRPNAEEDELIKAGLTAKNYGNNIINTHFVHSYYLYSISFSIILITLILLFTS